MANDQRVLARVSGEEAREYIRGVNAHVAKHTGKYRWPICGCVACFLLGAVLFGVMMGVFFEENRLRCNSRLCERGEDPLVDGCCVFWCCGEDMEGETSPRAPRAALQHQLGRVVERNLLRDRRAVLALRRGAPTGGPHEEGRELRLRELPRDAHRRKGGVQDHVRGQRQ